MSNHNPCNKNHSFVAAGHYFHDDYEKKQPVALEKYCVQEIMDRCTGHCDITETMLKMENVS